MQVGLYILYIETFIHVCVTVEPLLKDTLGKGHHRNYLPTNYTSLGPKNELLYSANTFFTSEDWTISPQLYKLADPNVSFIKRFPVNPHWGGST